MTKAFTAMVIIAFMASGCMIGTSHIGTGESLQGKQIAQIKPGTTTKQQILDWFGPPAAVARKSSVLKVPDKVSGTAGQSFEAGTFFELFSAKHDLTEHHIIYYYPATEVRDSQSACFFVHTSDRKVLTDQLWVLIDSRTGTVVDFIYRKALPETGPRPDEKAAKEKDTLIQ